MAKILKQLRPTTTAAQELYTPGTAGSRTVTAVRVCNTTGAAATFRLYWHEDADEVTHGFTRVYDESTALYWDKSVAAGDTHEISDIAWKLTGEVDSLGCRVDTASALTITVIGG